MSLSRSSVFRISISWNNSLLSHRICFYMRIFIVLFSSSYSPCYHINPRPCRCRSRFHHPSILNSQSLSPSIILISIVIIASCPIACSTAQQSSCSLARHTFAFHVLLSIIAQSRRRSSYCLGVSFTKAGITLAPSVFSASAFSEFFNHISCISFLLPNHIIRSPSLFISSTYLRRYELPSACNTLLS
ncbi:hypothetical protein CPC08DRAFT_339571 [Agrocybe pediades]|nr:hypothetical protein CPC08DRAFT_339571 [Agrocybe pediades]